MAGVGLRRRHQAYLFCACTRVTSGSSAFLFLFLRSLVLLSMADVNQRERYPQNVAVPSFRHKTSPDNRLQGRSKNVAPSSFPTVSPASLFVYMNFTSRACSSRPRTSTDTRRCRCTWIVQKSIRGKTATLGVVDRRQGERLYIEEYQNFPRKITTPPSCCVRYPSCSFGSGYSRSLLGECTETLIGLQPLRFSVDAGVPGTLLEISVGASSEASRLTEIRYDTETTPTRSSIQYSPRNL